MSPRCSEADSSALRCSAVVHQKRVQTECMLGYPLLTEPKINIKTVRSTSLQRDAFTLQLSFIFFVSTKSWKSWKPVSGSATTRNRDGHVIVILRKTLFLVVPLRSFVFVVLLELKYFSELLHLSVN